MGLFGNKKKESNEVSVKRNEALRLFLQKEETKSDIKELTDIIDEETLQLVNNLSFYVFEYIKQLKEAFVFSKGAVKKFILEDYPWVSKTNIDKLIDVGLKRM